MSQILNLLADAAQSSVREFGEVQAFLSGLLSRPKKVASLIPSSNRVKDELENLIRQWDPQFVVELGPGTGGTTQALLRGMSPAATLIAIEIVPAFVEQLRQIHDPRLIVCEGDVADLNDLLRSHGINADPELIVSGVPFSVMEPSKAQSLVATFRERLAPNGLFVAYQVRDKVSHYANQVFGEPSVSFIPWNLPPLRLYQWQKDEHVDAKATAVGSL